METSILIPHIEALVFVSDKPLSIGDITELLNNALGFIEDRVVPEQVATALEGLQEKYAADFYAFEIKQSGGGYQFLTKPAYYKTVSQLNGDKFLKKLSIAALETLSIIAYKQPVTKTDIELIRGVNCDYAVQKLLEKDLIIISGRNEDAVGKPLLYSTSKYFMDYFGLNSPSDLPQINEVLMQELVEATRVNGTGGNALVVEVNTHENSEEINGAHSVDETSPIDKQLDGSGTVKPVTDADSASSTTEMS